MSDLLKKQFKPFVYIRIMKLFQLGFAIAFKTYFTVNLVLSLDLVISRQFEEYSQVQKICGNLQSTSVL